MKKDEEGYINNFLTSLTSLYKVKHFTLFQKETFEPEPKESKLLVKRRPGYRCLAKYLDKIRISKLHFTECTLE